MLAEGEGRENRKQETKGEGGGERKQETNGGEGRWKMFGKEERKVEGKSKAGDVQWA